MLIYLILINAIAFLCMLIDKQKAMKMHRRIRESTLLIISALGGSLGTYAGMRLCRHKTRKPKFYIGVPCMIALHIVILILSIIVF